MPKKQSKAQVNSIVVISDTHSGCKLSLLHPDGAALDDGGVYTASPIIKKVWQRWEEFWGERVPKATKNEPFVVVHNGDALEGQHHEAKTPWSNNVADQGEHAYKILKPIVDLCEERYYQIRGTEAHVGKSAEEEERLAQRLGAIPNDQGQHSRWELWTRLHGKLIHFSHHIGTTSSAQHETSALNAELAGMYTDCCRWGSEPPLIVVRSHRHMSSEIRLPCEHGYATVFVTPCWQLRTPFAYRTKAGRVSTPQLGGSLIRFSDGDLFTRHAVWPVTRPPEVAL